MELSPMLYEVLFDDLLQNCVMSRCDEAAPEHVTNILEKHHIKYEDKSKDYLKIAYQVKDIHNDVDWLVDINGNHKQSAIDYMILLQAICGKRYMSKFQCLINELP